MRLLRLTAVLVLLAGAATACGGDSSTPSAGGSSSSTAGGGGLELHAVIARYATGMPLGPQVPQQLTQELKSYDCSKGAETMPDGSVIMCDAKQVKFLLDPQTTTVGVASAVSKPSKPAGTAYVLVQLDKDGTAALSQLTQGMTGRELAVVDNGTVLAAPLVEQQITDGRLAIVGEYTTAQATQLADRIAAS